MNYERLYNNIIANANTGLRRKYRGTYYERHHIVPRSLGGTDEKSNLVLLTAKEHFVCHHLLHKMYGGPMTYAFWYMCNIAPYKGQQFTPNARLFEQARLEFVQLISGRWTGSNNPNHNRSIKGDLNPMYGTSRTGSSNPFFGRKHTTKTKELISTANKGRLSGRKNCNSKGWIHTPRGVFDSCAAAGRALSCDQSTIWKRCSNPNFPEYYLIEAN